MNMGDEISMKTLIFILFIIGIIFFQIFLSKKERKIFGLILPTITFILSFITIANIYLEGNESIGQIVYIFIIIFIISNITTIILLIIYVIYHPKVKTGI